MSSENSYKYISPFIVLALILAITSEYCSPKQGISGDERIYTASPSSSFNPFCHIKRFGPESPETHSPYQASPYYMTSSTVASGTSIYPSPSPAPSDFDEA